MGYRLAIFDFDGTLADSFHLFLSVVDELAHKHRFKRLDSADLDSFRRLSAREMLDRLGLPAWKVPLIGSSFKSLMAERVAEVAPFSGITPMLHALAARGVVLSLVTSNSKKNVARVLSPECMALFVVPQCGTSLFGKPSRLRAVLRHTGIAAHEAIFIGDELRDLEAARAAGVAFGAVSWGYTHADALREQRPTHQFDRAEEIVTAVVGAVA